MKKQFSVDFEENVVINGSKQNIRVRAEKEGLPVILFLHGGPGVCDRHVVMKYQSELAKDFYSRVLGPERKRKEFLQRHNRRKAVT